MKKNIAIFLIATSLLTLASCKKKDEENPSTSDNSTISSSDSKIVETETDDDEINTANMMFPESPPENIKLSKDEAMNIVSEKVELEKNLKIRYDSLMALDSEHYHSVIVYEETADEKSTHTVATYYVRDSDSKLYELSPEEMVIKKV